MKTLTPPPPPVATPVNSATGPLISVLRGAPDPAELAALTAVLLSRLRESAGAPAEPAPAPARAPWSRPAFHSAASWHAPDGLGR